MQIEPKLRNALIFGALIGAVVGAGAGWLLTQSAEDDPFRSKEPIQVGDLLKLTGTAAFLVRQLDDLRHRL